MVKEKIFEEDLLVILGPTATGKTKLAVQLAHKLSGEIISADSRQVYRGMNIGTGKDLNEYNFKGVSIPYHLIDIVAPIEEYNVAQFQRDFQRVYSDIKERKKLPILCGGTGFYIKAVLMEFQLPKTEPDKQLRQKLENWEFEDLINELETISPGASANTPVDTKHLVPLWRKKFIGGMLKRGYQKKLAMEMWSMVQSFSGYSFCKPHSASYAMLSFTCAYLKAHFPAEFLAAVVSNQGGFYSAFAYLSEARRWGIAILPPHINHSFKEYRGNAKRIRMGFMSIRNLKEKAVTQIMEERKGGDFKSLEDFFHRTDLDLADAMALANAGCFAELEREQSHQQIAFRIACHYLQDGEDEDVLPSFGDKRLTHAEKISLERESFGFPVYEHPLTPWLPLFVGKIKKARDIPKYVGQTIQLAGVLITTKVTATRKHEPMEFLTLEDETDIYECVMFPDAFAQYGDLLNWEKLLIIRGKVEVSFGVYTITIEKMGSIQRMGENLRKRRQKTGIRRQALRHP